MAQRVEEGYQVFTADGGEEVGAVREVQPAGRAEIVVYVENYGEVLVPLAAVRSVHDGKVILDLEALDSVARGAIAHAHDAERSGL
jgi:ribosomal 30S subunit maturation factor RimM